MNVETIVDAVANTLNIDPVTAGKAVGTIFSILEHEAGPQATDIIAKIDGAGQLATQNDVDDAPAPGGLLGSIGSALGGVMGDKAGALVKGMAQLQSLGLDLSQIAGAGRSILQHARQAAGPNAVNNLLDQVPALKSHLGQ